MSIISRAVFREVGINSLLGIVLFTFVLFLQSVSKLFEVLVRSSASAQTIAKLFFLVLPPALVFTIPLGTLVGILIALSRMSADQEIVALRASGVPARRVAWPVLTVAVLSLAASAACALWLNPLAIRETYRLTNKLAAEMLTAEIQPRVFAEQFPNTILYVGDVVPGPRVRWRKVFIADVTPPDQRKKGSNESGEGPRVTIAREAVAVPDVVNNRIQLSLQDGSTHEVGKSANEYYNSAFPKGDQVLQASKPKENGPKEFTEMDVGPLQRAARGNPDAQIELHRRFALPLACVVLALIGVPLGVTSRKGGKPAAFVLTVAVAIAYYTALIALIGLAKQRSLPVPVAVWLPNAVLAVLGVVFVSRLELPGDRDFVAEFRNWAARRIRYYRLRRSRRRGKTEAATLGRIPLVSQIIDTYILRSFLYYFVLLLTTFVLVVHVFTFFELLSDIIRNRIPMARVFTYLLFLTPKLIYDSAPISVLVAVLVTFGVLAKQNEITAFKACGVSQHRLALPILVVSLLFSGALFAFDYRYIPSANRIQEAIRAEIKGKPSQTFLRPDRPWIYGNGNRIYNYKYFDPNESVMLNVSVYELDPETFHLKRHISAERAHWATRLNTWVFENGWVRDIDGIKEKQYRPFPGQTATFAELNEAPQYFLKEVIPDKQMNFRALDRYIRELQQSGFDTVRLRVQYYKKFAVPLFAVIMALISVPFAFGTGARGAMAGVGVSFGVAIAYWSISQLFEQVGNLAQLPPVLAAWAPDTLFTLAGLYLLLRMRT